MIMIMQFPFLFFHRVTMITEKKIMVVIGKTKIDFRRTISLCRDATKRKRKRDKRYVKRQREICKYRKNNNKEMGASRQGKKREGRKGLR